MATTIEKKANGNVIINRGYAPISVIPESNVNPDTMTEDGIIISNSFNQQYFIEFSDVTGLSIEGTGSVTIPADRDALIQELAENFFFTVLSGGAIQDVNVVSPSPLSVEVDNFPDPQNVSIENDSVGLSKEAKQDVGNTSLANIDGKVSTEAKQDDQISELQDIEVLADNINSKLNLDGFGRLRTTGGEIMLFESSMEKASSLELFWSNLVTGDATATQDTDISVLEMNATSGTYTNQTKERFHYQKGKLQLIFLTGLFSQEAGATKNVGYVDFDRPTLPAVNGTVQNGVYLSVEETNVYFKINKNGANTESAEKSAWNIDRFDGSGGPLNPSGITLNLDAVQILFISVEWLGVGEVIAGFKFADKVYPAHVFLHANETGNTEPYMATANLSAAYQLIATGTPASLKQICCAVNSVGGQDLSGINLSLSNQADIQIQDGDFGLLLGIRLKDANINTVVKLISTELIIPSDGNSDVYICFNPTYTGTVTWEDRGSEYPVEVAEGNGNTITDLGIELPGFYLAKGIRTGGLTDKNKLKLGKALDGTLDEIWIIPQPTGGNEEFRGKFNFNALI